MMKPRCACPWWHVIAPETACVVSWSCKKRCVCDPRTSCFPLLVLQCVVCVGVTALWWCLCVVSVVLFFVVVVLVGFVFFFCSMVFFSFESFLRFHCLGTLSTCLVFKFLLLNCVKRETIREQSESLRSGSRTLLL